MKHKLICWQVYQKNKLRVVIFNERAQESITLFVFAKESFSATDAIHTGEACYAPMARIGLPRHSLMLAPCKDTERTFRSHTA